MTYDLNGAWDPVTGHNAPLFQGEGDEGLVPEDMFTVEQSLKYWISAGKNIFWPLLFDDDDVFFCCFGGGMSIKSEHVLSYTHLHNYEIYRIWLLKLSLLTSGSSH